MKDTTITMPWGEFKRLQNERDAALDQLSHYRKAVNAVHGGDSTLFDEYDKILRRGEGAKWTKESK